MCDHAAAERVEVVAAFEGGDHAAVGVALCDGDHLARDPGEVVLDEAEVGEWVVQVGVENPRRTSRAPARRRRVPGATAR